MQRPLLALVALLLLPAAAGAQPVPTGPVPATPISPPTVGLLVEPGDVRRCLCLERSVATLNEEVGARNRMYEESRRQLQQLDADIEQRRETINVGNPAEVETFRDMYDRRQTLFERITGDIVSDYSITVERYNRSVADFNQACSGKAYYPPTLAAVQPGLGCPAP